MPNVMAALPNIGGALCSTSQFGWRPTVPCSNAEICRGASNSPTDFSR